MTGRRGSRDAGSADLDLFDSGDAPPKRRVASSPPPPPPEDVDPNAYPGETAQTAVTVSVLTQTARDVI
ncbi:MAG: hypothetical protein ABJF01_13795, partial [bacterium]